VTFDEKLLQIFVAKLKSAATRDYVTDVVFQFAASAHEQMLVRAKARRKPWLVRRKSRSSN
jgi:hypothetical protein